MKALPVLLVIFGWKPGRKAAGRRVMGGSAKNNVVRAEGVITEVWDTGLAPAPEPMIVDTIPPDHQDDLVAALDRLAQLHRDGALTSAEFARAKQRLLGRG